MASLDNFNTWNGARMMYPSLRERWSALGKALYTPTAFDVPNEVPVATVNVRDSLKVHQGSRTPQVESARDTWMNRYFMPLTPYTKRMQGSDSTEAIQLYNPHLSGMARLMPGTRAPLRQVDATHVYRHTKPRTSWFKPY